MKQEIATKWVGALRSGEYTKCTGRLQQGEAFCSLGVLSLLSVRENGGPFFDERQEKDLISQKTIEWSGLDRAHLWDLVHLNDREGKSFGEFADYIEKNWETL